MTADPTASAAVVEAFALAATLSAVISPLKSEMPRTSLTPCAVVPSAYALDERPPDLTAVPSAGCANASAVAVVTSLGAVVAPALVPGWPGTFTCTA